MLDRYTRFVMHLGNVIHDMWSVFTRNISRVGSFLYKYILTVILHIFTFVAEVIDYIILNVSLLLLEDTHIDRHDNLTLDRRVREHIKNK